MAEENKVSEGVEEQKDDKVVVVDPNAGKKPAPNPTDGPTEEQKKEATAGYDAQLAAMQDAMKRYAPETEEERKKRERREKASKLVAAISDGIQAVSNLWFTSQYATNAYNHDKQSMVKSESARFDKLKAERDANADRYYNYAMQAGNAAAGRAKTLRELEAQHQAQQLARAKAQREEEAQDWKRLLQPDLQREQAGKANKAEQEAIAAQNKAAVSADLAEAEVDATKARAEASRASASNSRASAAAHNRSNAAEFYAWDEKGHEHKFRTQAAADAYAKQHGTWQEEEVEETSTVDSETNGKSTTTKKRKVGRPVKPATDDDTPPSRR